MKISVNWLKDFVFLPDVFDVQELAEQLTMHSVEVEGIKKQADFLDGVVVGEILEVKKHPDADKLSIARVDVGEAKPRQIVFGQMVKMEKGFKIPVALAPTVLPGSRAIHKVKMRGEVSEGMLCLDQELGLADEGVTIHFFDKKVKNGTSIVKALHLGDVIIDIENKTMTHRPDLWGHYGLAREVAAIQRKKLKEYKVAAIKPGNEQKIRVKVEDAKLCPRYMAVMLDGIKVEASPEWMQKRLMSVGVRPINNIVDISNYVMLEIGQPMHAFDADKIADHSIVVRRARDKEKFVTLNDVKYELTSDTLVIADKDKAVAIAGIKGDKESGVTEATTSVIFEAANFDPITVRKTAQRLALRTDSSSRFEKSLDPNVCELALRRAVELTREICKSANVVSNVVDEGKAKLNQGQINVPFDFLNKKIGAEIEKKKVIDMLERLGFSVQVKKDGMTVKVPTWRATKDIRIKEDIVEEVARMYGYGAIPTTLPSASIAPPVGNVLRETINIIQNVCALECGFNEVMNYSFVSPELLHKLEMNPKDHIELNNPVAKDRPYLRRYLMPNMLESLEANLHRFDSVRLFEIGRVFRMDEPGERAVSGSNDLLPRQDSYLGVVCATKGDDTPFYKVSSLVRTVLDRLRVAYAIQAADPDGSSFVHPGRFAYVKVNDTIVARIAELHPKLQHNMGISERVGMLELNINDLISVLRARTQYHVLPVFPEVERDIAFVVSKNMTHEDIEQAIRASDSLVVGVKLFDVFKGKNVKEGHKSMAYRLTYRADDRTLEAKEIDAIQKKIETLLIKHFKAEIRT